MRKKIVLSVCFLVSLLPMLLYQYGGMKGVQEISGLINLINPIGIVSVILFAVGVWLLSDKPAAGRIVGGLGTVGIVVSEVYKFFTWYTETIIDEITLQRSLNMAFPEFYFGLAASIIMVILFFVIWEKPEDTVSA